MNDNQIKKLKTHVLEISAYLINEISAGDTILNLEPDGSVIPDAVSNHHLIELLCKMDPNIFMHYCLTLFKWLSDSSNGYSDHPFTLDSYTNFCNHDANNDKLFTNTISKQQLKDGSIPIYTALIQGGDFFSTLWSLKILIRYNPILFSETIEQGIKFLLAKQEVAARTPSQRGFLLYVLLNYNPAKYNTIISSLYSQIKQAVQTKPNDKNVIQVIDDIYLLEDIQKYFQVIGDTEAKKLVEDMLITLFELEQEPKKIPEIFGKFKDTKPESPFNQLLLKSAQVAVEYLNHIGDKTNALELNAYLHGKYRQNRYKGLLLEKELKEYKQQYGNIEKDFRHYDETLKLIWKESNSDYEHSIFLMMPFRTDINHRMLTKAIQKTCRKHGYRVFRVDDKYRKPFDTLWDNIVLNMLACKYGISVYLSDKSIDKLTDELRFFENPNVALEFGFMKSRGKKILILKDMNSKTPSDLQGFYWKPFDIKNPDESVPGPIEAWIKEFLKSEEENI
jgi:hypothetical protein